MDPINLRPRKSVLNRCSALLLTQKCLTAPSYVSTKAAFLVTTVSIPVFANHFYPALDISRGNIQISWDSLPVHGSSLSLDKHLSIGGLWQADSPANSSLTKISEPAAGDSQLPALINEKRSMAGAAGENGSH